MLALCQHCGSIVPALWHSSRTHTCSLFAPRTPRTLRTLRTLRIPRTPPQPVKALVNAHCFMWPVEALVMHAVSRKVSPACYIHSTLLAPEAGVWVTAMCCGPGEGKQACTCLYMSYGAEAANQGCRRLCGCQGMTYASPVVVALCLALV